MHLPLTGGALGLLDPPAVLALSQTLPLLGLITAHDASLRHQLAIDLGERGSAIPSPASS